MIWHNPTTTPPPAYEDVLLAIRGEERASEGCLLIAPLGSAARYSLSTGHFVDSAKVYAWAELPFPPEIAQMGGAA